MSCRLENRNSQLLQSFIHLMNDFENRNEVIDYHLRASKQRDKYQWMGTWVVHQQGSDLFFLEKDPHIFSSSQQLRKKTLSVRDFVHQRQTSFQQKSVFTAFTVCIVYDGNLVHYVAFLYDPYKKRLTSFDPGVELYHHGQKTIVPLVQDAFLTNGLLEKGNHSHRILGSCHVFRFKNKKHGVQFNGNTSSHLPADAFCQSWTLFFLVRLFYTTDDMEVFLKNWCEIEPQNREYFIVSFFVIPTLMYFPSILERYKEKLPFLKKGTHGSRLIEEIFLPIERCFFKAKHIKQG